MIDTGKKLGRFRIYACSGSMAILNITRDELIEEVDESTGLVGFLNLVKDARPDLIHLNRSVYIRLLNISCLKLRETQIGIKSSLPMKLTKN